MSGIDLDAIRARAAAAYEGPWWPFLSGIPGAIYMPDSWTVHSDERFICDLNVDTHEAGATAEFIAHAREDIPALLDEVERLRADRDAQGRFLSTVDKFARASAMSHDAVLGAVGVKADLDRAEATIARVRKLADSWDDLIAEERNQKRTWCAGMIEAAQSDLRAAIEGTDS